MPSMMQMLRDLTPLRRFICANDYDRTVEYLCGVLPFEIETVSEDRNHNGWMIPPKWEVVEASISIKEKVIYDGLWHPLAVIATSAPFEGCVDRDELRRHLHYDHRDPDSLTFHFRQQFRSWERDWGFCVPKTFYDRLESGAYDVVIRTEEGPGYLTLLVFTIEGEIPETIVVSAQPDHPGVSNDGLAGAVVGIELFRRLALRPRRYTYKLVLVPGILGTEYYLALRSAEERRLMIDGICLWMLGSETELALQRARSQRSLLERAVERSLKQEGVSFRTGEFEEIMINDEYIWEAYGVPMPHLSRFPYPQYHSSRDSLDIMSEQSLEESVAILEEAIEWTDSSPVVRKRFEGTICLSHPDYDLYVDPGQISFGEVVGDEATRLRRLMDLIPAVVRPTPMKLLAAQVGLSEARVLEYLRRWASRGLIELE